MSILLKKQNENFIKIECPRDVAMSIFQHFQFYVDGYKFTPQYKYGNWDGKIKLFSLRDYTFPIGLLFDLIRFLNKNEEEFVFLVKFRHGTNLISSGCGLNDDQQLV